MRNSAAVRASCKYDEIALKMTQASGARKSKLERDLAHQLILWLRLSMTVVIRPEGMARWLAGVLADVKEPIKPWGRTLPDQEVMRQVACSQLDRVLPALASALKARQVEKGNRRRVWIYPYDKEEGLYLLIEAIPKAHVRLVQRAELELPWLDKLRA